MSVSWKTPLNGLPHFVKANVSSPPTSHRNITAALDPNPADEAVDAVLPEFADASGSREAATAPCKPMLNPGARSR